MRICLMILISCLGLSGMTQHTLYPLYKPDTRTVMVDVSEMGHAPLKERALRAEGFEINPALQAQNRLRPGDTIALQVMEQLQVRACVDRAYLDVNQAWVIRAKVLEYDYAWFYMSTYEGNSLIQLDIPEEGRLLRSWQDPESSQYYLYQQDPHKDRALEGSAPLPIPPDGAGEGRPEENQEPAQEIPAPSAPSLQDGGKAQTTITVLVVYTPAAASWSATNETSIQNTIALMMAKGQTALDNSNTEITLQVVHATQVAYTELNNSSDLDRLTFNNDGYMDTVHVLRDAYCADMVVLLEQVSFTGGIAWLLNTTSGSPSYAFSLTRVQQASWTFTAVHEIAHNMGCHHHKQQTTQPGPGLYTYSAGWRWTGTNNGKYCSVMTYESGSYFADGVTHSRVPHFSNPSINYQGVATGHATDGDNARNLRQIKDVIAAYRSNCSTTDPCSNVITIAGCGSSNAVSYSGGGTGLWFTSSTNPCGYTSPGIEQVYQFTAPTTGTYSLQVTSASGYVDYMWKAGSCASGGWTCIDDILVPGTYGSMSWVAGTTYYILLDDENNTSGTHVFHLNCPAQAPTLAVTASVQPPAVCYGQTAQLMATPAGGNPAGYAYAWSSNPPAFSSSQQAPQVTPAVTTTYTVTLSDGSQSATSSITLTINPLPSVSWSSTFSSACINANPLTLVGGSPAGGTYGGQGVIGGVFYPSSAGAGTHSLQYFYTDGNGCTNLATRMVTVHPLPVVAWNTPLSAQCVTATSYPLSGGSPAGGTYSGPGVSGNTFNASSAGVGTHSLTYTYTDGNGCTASVTRSIQVYNTPIVSWNTALTGQCITATSYSLSGGSPAGGTYSGPGVSGNTFNASNAGVGTHSLTYTYTDGNGCTASVTRSIQVYNTPIVSWNTALAGQCITATSYPLSGGIPAGGTYSGPGVSGNTFNASNAGVGTHSLTYTYTDGNGCTASVTRSIQVYNTPIVSWNTALAGQCITATSYSLSGGSPAGGTYSGPGVNGSIFNASSAGVGTHSLTYTYTDGNGCNASATNSIQVYNLPIVSWNTALTGQCITATSYPLSGGSPAGGTYTGTGVSGNTFNASSAGVGTHSLTYTYTDGNGCTNGTVNTIDVHALPVVSWPVSLPNILPGSPAIMLSGGQPAGGTYSGAGVIGQQFDPALAGSGTHLLTYTYTNNAGCTASATNSISVDTLPGTLGILQGRVLYANGLGSPMPGMQVLLKQSGQILDSCISNTAGEYTFTAMPGSYRLTARTTLPWPHGPANASDALEVLKHFVQTITLTGIHYLAGDVNGSNNLNTSDALLIASRFVGSASAYPAGDWVFTSHDVLLPGGALVQQDVQVLVYGDVNASYNPASKREAARILARDRILDISMEEEIMLPVYVTEPLSMAALSLIMHYPHDYVEIREVVIMEPYGNLVYEIDEGQIRIAWYRYLEQNLAKGDLLLQLRMLLKRPSDDFNRQPWFMTMASSSGIEDETEKSLPALSIPALLSLQPLVLLEPLRPNPARELTTLAFQLKNDGWVRIEVLDALGQQLATLADQHFSSGRHVIDLNCAAFHAGLYHIKLNYNNEGVTCTRSSKLIVR